MFTGSRRFFQAMLAAACLALSAGAAAQNLILNPSFETLGQGSWTSVIAGPAAWVDSGATPPTTSGVNGLTSNQGGPSSQILYQDIVLPATGVYTISAQIGCNPQGGANTRLADAGPVSLAFDDAAHGTLVWPGGTVAIERFGFGTSGPSTPPLANQPQSGWWWGGPADDGRGYFIEWQGSQAFLAGYMYDTEGNPVWYVSQGAVSNAQSYQGTWLQLADGQTLAGPYKPAALVNENVAPVTIQFQGADTAILTLPSGTLPLSRFRY